MSTSTVTASTSAWVNQDPAHRDENYGGAYRLWLSDASGQHRHGFVSMSPGSINGLTVLDGRFRIQAAEALSAQTITIQACNSTRWSPSKVTWNNAPGVTGPTATVTIPATGANRWVEVDVTALVQQIANGAGTNGWRITTTAGSPQRINAGFELSIEVSDAPVTPTQLVPVGVVGREKPVVSCDYNDLSGEADIAGMQVQIDPDADDVSPAFDSGTVAVTVASLDTATTTYAGLADTASTQWRTRTLSTQGKWSGWSDWVTMTRVVKPAFAFTAPIGGTVTDPTPLIQGSVDTGVIETIDLVVTPDGDPLKIRYDSPTLAPGTATFSHEIPFKYLGNTVLPDSGDYRVTARVVDRLDRVYDGDPPYLEDTVVFAIVGSGAGPDTLTAAPVPGGGPGIRLVATRGTDPDRLIVIRGGQRIARLTVGDDVAATSPYTWDDVSAPPGVPVTYTVRADTGGVESNDSPAATATSDVKGMWLVSAHGNVKIHNPNVVGGLRVTDRRATMELPYRPDTIDIIGALGGLSGSVEGILNDRDDGIAAKKATVEAIRRDPTTPIRLVFAQTSIPVLLRNVTVIAAEYITPSVGTLSHTIAFECWQCGEFPVIGAA